MTVEALAESLNVHFHSVSLTLTLTGFSSLLKREIRKSPCRQSEVQKGPAVLFWIPVPVTDLPSFPGLGLLWRSVFAKCVIAYLLSRGLLLVSQRGETGMFGLRVAPVKTHSSRLVQLPGSTGAANLLSIAAAACLQLFCLFPLPLCHFLSLSFPLCLCFSPLLSNSICKCIFHPAYIHFIFFFLCKNSTDLVRLLKLRHSKFKCLWGHAERLNENILDSYSLHTFFSPYFVWVSILQKGAAKPQKFGEKMMVHLHIFAFY